MVYQTVYSVVIFIHRYLDRDRINFQNLCIPGCFNGPSEHIQHTHQKFQTIILNGASTMLNNVFNIISKPCTHVNAAIQKRKRDNAFKL